MRMSWLVLPLTLAVLSLTGTARAEQEVLDSLINVALANNPELAAAEHLRQAATYTTKSAGALPDPTLTVGMVNLPSNSLALDETPMSSVMVGVMQMIPWPGKLGSRTELARTGQIDSEANKLMIRNRIVRQVTDAYLDYAYWTNSLSVIDEYLGLLKGTRDIADTRYSNGQSSAQDLLRASSMLSRAEIRRLRAGQNRLSSLLKLRQAIGDTVIANDLPASLDQPDIEPAAENIDSNPILTSAASGVKRAEVGYRLARQSYWPDFTLGVDYGIRKDIPGDPVHGTDFLTFKVGVTLPLWFFAKQKHNVQSAQATVLSSKSRERSMRDMLTTQYDDALSNLSVTRESLNKYDSALVPEANAAMEAAEVAYEVGKIDFNALLAAQSDAFEIRIERLDLLRQYHKTKAALKELTGGEVTK